MALVRTMGPHSTSLRAHYMRLLPKLWVQRHSHWTQWMAVKGHGGRLWGRKRPLRWWAGSICPPLPPHLASRQPEASFSTMAKFSVSGWLKMLTLEGAIEGNINTMDGGDPFIHPFQPFSHWLSSFSFQLLSPFSPFSQPQNFRPRYFSHTLQRGGRQELS